MHITSIELENIKSHVNSRFEFERGTTAIMGENGAGKTTLIEAVGWTLFDLLEYKKEEFLRRGVKKGSARVTFESSLDERQYTVIRDTATGYYVHDPRLNARIADKKEEVSRFLTQHLGVEPGTDLRALFRQAVGVPQGTLTADFLRTPEQRKPIFDKLLKVEEYRRGADELLKTARFVEQKISAVRERIARAEGELSRFDEIETQHKNATTQSEDLMKNLDTVGKEAEEKSALVNSLNETEAKVSALVTELEKFRADKTKNEIELRQKESDLNQARTAAEKIKAVEPAYKKHIAALARLKELERERGLRDKLQASLTKTETAGINVKAEQASLTEKLENALAAHREIADLADTVKQFEELDARREALRNILADSRAREEELGRINEQIERKRAQYRENHSNLLAAEGKSKEAKSIEYYQSRDHAIAKNITQLRIKLETDEKFQAEIKGGLCPILSEKCLNLAEGQTLENFLKSQFSETKTQIETLEVEREKVKILIKSARGAEKSAAEAATWRKRETDLAEDGIRLKAEKERLEKEAVDVAKTRAEFDEVEAAIKALDDPKAKTRMFEAVAKSEILIREKLSETEKNLERLESDRRLEAEQLSQYETLDREWSERSDEREQTTEAHRTFLANEAAAALLANREKEFETARNKAAELDERVKSVEKDLELIGKGYDRERHQAEKISLAGMERRQAELSAAFEILEKRKNELGSELARLADVRKSMQTELMEKERLEKVCEVTAFIRDTLKDAAPRVAQNYVYHVSVDANHMFREITGNAEHTLKWAEDYSIMLEEGGWERPFVSLSGGEQMAAALSVRLALLKQLSDVRIAFFDEPTTNMDAERRENFAQQIGRIKHFDQLFIISHDDTFHGHVDNEIRVDNENQQPEQAMLVTG